MDSPPHFAIAYDLDSMTCDSRGIVTGIIALELGAIAFPDQRWSDFVIRTLSTWIPSVRIVLGPHGRDQFLFMDGPYGFFAHRKDGVIDIECYRDHKLRRAGPSARVNAMQFGAAMYTTSRKIENWARKTGCISRDLELLSDENAALRDILGPLVR